MGYREKLAQKEVARKKYDDAVTEISNKYGFSWVFGKEQLDEYIAEQRKLGYEGKFTTLNSLPGSICRSETVKQWVEDYLKIQKQYDDDLKGVFEKDEYIEYQLSNHECYYTGNYGDEYVLADIQAVFPETTKDEIKKVYYATINNHE